MMTRTVLLLCALTLLAPTARAAEGVAIFASGCFWCTEADFEKVEGVIGAESGYIGGHVDDPRYEQVSAGGTGHIEAVRVHFDPERVSYEALLAVYWRNVDPYTPNAQFCDKGPQYRSAIFPVDASQRAAAEQSRDALTARYPDRPAIVTEILPATRFWPAEAYHQDYYRKNPIRYRYYRNGCGRDRRLTELWGKSP
jgi:peptide-methionine (S)-S-oxide reductase